MTKKITVEQWLVKGQLFIHGLYPTVPWVYEIIEANDSFITVYWNDGEDCHCIYSRYEVVQFFEDGEWIAIDKSDKSKYNGK